MTPELVSQMPLLRGDEIDFTNPNDPKTKKYLAEQEVLESRIVCAKKWLAIQQELMRMQEAKEEAAFRVEREVLAEMAMKAFMEELNEKTEAMLKQPGVEPSELKQAMIEEQKVILEESIAKLEEEKQQLIEEREELIQEADVVVKSVSKEWQTRHEKSVNEAIAEYKQKSEAFLARKDNKEDKEFHEKVAQFEQLKTAYETEAKQFRERMMAASSEVSKLNYEKNKLEKIQKALPKKERELQEHQEKMNDPELNEIAKRHAKNSMKELTKAVKHDKRTLEKLEIVNQDLKEAEDQKAAVLKEKEESGLSAMRKELAGLSEFNEDKHVAKTPDGKVVSSEELKQSVMQAKSNIDTIAKPDLNQVIMLEMDEMKEESDQKQLGKTTKELSRQVSMKAVGLNLLVAQVKRLNQNGPVRPSNVKKDDAASAVQARALEETRQEDEAAAEKIIGANYKVHTATKKIADKDQELYEKNKELEALQSLKEQDLQITSQYKEVRVSESEFALLKHKKSEAAPNAEQSHEPLKPTKGGGVSS